MYALNGSTGDAKWNFTTGGYIWSTPALGSDGTLYIGSNDFKMYALTTVCDGGTYKSQPSGLCLTCPELFYCPAGPSIPIPCSSQEYCPTGSVSPQTCNVSCPLQYFKNISTCSCGPTPASTTNTTNTSTTEPCPQTCAAPVCFDSSTLNCSLGSCHFDFSPAGQQCTLSSCAEGGRCDGSGTCASLCGNAGEASNSNFLSILLPCVLVPALLLIAFLVWRWNTAALSWCQESNRTKAQAQPDLSPI